MSANHTDSKSKLLANEEIPEIKPFSLGIEDVASRPTKAHQEAEFVIG